AGCRRTLWRADCERLAYRGDDDAAHSRQFFTEERQSRFARYRRIALAQTSAARRRPEPSALSPRSYALAIKARSRRRVDPVRGAKSKPRSRHEPEGDEYHRLSEHPLKVGIVSDLHCNIGGLAQALDLIGDVDELICLGDSIWEYRF